MTEISSTGSVSALEWDEFNRAETAIGTYQILRDHDEGGGPDQLCVELDRPVFGTSFVHTKQGATWGEASAAAQADYNRRVGLENEEEAAPSFAPG